MCTKSKIKGTRLQCYLNAFKVRGNLPQSDMDGSIFWGLFLILLRVCSYIHTSNCLKNPGGLLPPPLLTSPTVEIHSTAVLSLNRERNFVILLVGKVTHVDIRTIQVKTRYKAMFSVQRMTSR